MSKRYDDNLRDVIIDDRDMDWLGRAWRWFMALLRSLLALVLVFLATGGRPAQAQGGWEDNEDWQKICNSGGSIEPGFSGPAGLTDTEEDIDGQAGGCSWVIFPDIYTNPGFFDEFYEFTTPWFDFSSPVERIEFIGSFRMDTPEPGFFGEDPDNLARYCTDVGLEYTVDGQDQIDWVVQYIGGEGLPEDPPPTVANEWHTPANGLGLDEEVIMLGSNTATRARFRFKFNQNICYHIGVYANTQNIYRFLIDNLGIRGLSTTLPTPTATATATATTNPTPATPTNTPVIPQGTATPTNTPNPAFDTPTAEPECHDACPTSTPTLVKRFPESYDFVPTALPPILFPTWPAPPKLTPVPRPLPVSLPLIPTAPPIPPLTASLVLSYPTPMAINLTVVATVEPTATGPATATPTPWGLIDSVNGYTDWLSNTVASIEGSEVITLANAPASYATAMPRELADVGYTFEQLAAGGVDKGYSLNSWAALFGYMVAIPIRFVKNLWELFVFMGPIGLFFAWLFVMLPVALFFKAIVFLRMLIVRLLNFVLNVFDFLWKLWEAIPFIN